LKKTIVVNLFGGPGISKSTTATGVFSLLKMHDVDCEYVSEFAKDLVWEKREKSLKNQIYIFSKQYHRLWRVNGIVDIIVTDSPLLLSVIYANETKAEVFKNMVMDEFNSFNNLNFLLKRTKKYNPNGRYQTEDEAKKLDKKIEDLLTTNNFQFSNISGNYNAVTVISKLILDKLGKKQKYRIEAIK
jgi:AAA domain